MRTALVLLLLLALASVVGSLVPQGPNSPERVARFQVDHPLLGDFYRHAGFFDVFGSWWFVLITTLLVISLVLCLVPRTRAAIRGLRQRPVQAREIDGFPQYSERTVATRPELAIASSQKVLRRRMFRVSRAEGVLAAEKGTLREVGSLLFHWSFLLLLVGVIYGKGTGFTGKALVVEGETWTDGAANYDGTVREGRFFSGDFTGVGVRLLDFEDTYRRTGQPMDFVSHVDLLEPDGSLAGRADIRVNHPAEIDGLSIYQYGFGWAPVVEVREGDRLLYSAPAPFGQLSPPAGVPQLALPWNGVVKLPSVGEGLGIQLVLWPDSSAYLQSLETGRPVLMTQANHPIMFFTTWRGPLLDPSPRSLDISVMRRWTTGTIGQGTTCDLATGKCWEDGTRPVGPGELTMSFPALRQYSVLQVSRDRGVPIVLAAAILLLLGLLPALYTSRRKVWVRAEANGEGTVLKVGGFALQRKSQFEEEFSKLVDELERASGEKVGTR
ncbi:MAG: cytochrome c biogenesis protein ResB [Actinobacteria bacterium]|nr:cytochrome c biogenesis protein ResB [Actinomycetota bacterium]